ncbi:lipid droplet-associated hydrolase-like isoform X3 [Anneissia japonica]|nr:lipid droplet-associated hydrolase-like isoform X3 [Anneissia japonica]
MTFYEVFMEELFMKSQKKIPVWGISHAGHHHKSTPIGQSAITKGIQSNFDVYSLRGQIEHKKAFVKENIPPNKRLILIGHSIGCYIILKMIDELPEMNVIKSYLLFPTIERMLASPNGMLLGPILMYLRWLAIIPIYFASFLPESIQKRLIQWHFRNRNIPGCTVQGVLNLFDPMVAANAFYMAAHEMRQVKECDYQLLERHASKLCLYYGSSDGWCPVNYYEDIKKSFPDEDIRLCKEGMEHAFCLTSSMEMAQVMWPWLMDDINKS